MNNTLAVIRAITLFLAIACWVMPTSRSGMTLHVDLRQHDLDETSVAPGDGDGGRAWGVTLRGEMRDRTSLRAGVPYAIGV